MNCLLVDRTIPSLQRIITAPHSVRAERVRPDVRVPAVVADPGLVLVLPVHGVEAPARLALVRLGRLAEILRATEALP